MISILKILFDTKGGNSNLKKTLSQRKEEEANKRKMKDFAGSNKTRFEFNYFLVSLDIFNLKQKSHQDKISK